VGGTSGWFNIRRAINLTYIEQIRNNIWKKANISFKKNEKLKSRKSIIQFKI
jgi:hypothetical protein